MDRTLTTQQVAERLGVKPETVYAYVSRGILVSRRSPTGRGSVFDATAVEAVARTLGRRRPQGSPGSPLAVRTGVTLIEADTYYFRGVDAVALARAYRFEETANWLWTGELTRGTRFTAPPAAVTASQLAVDSLPTGRGLLDVLRVATVAASVTDPLRFDLSPDTVHATAHGLIATLVAATCADDHASPDSAVADQLWNRLAAGPPNPAALRCLDAALVLLIDHDLAASTFAARVAASARADPYAVVSAALGALEGPLHGAASRQAHRMLTDALSRGSAAAVVAEHLREGRRIPGLGHRIYPREDPRAELLFELLGDWPAAAPLIAAAREIASTAAAHIPLYANVDLALAVLTVAADMPPDAGECIFAIARTVGWIAHALEEYDERPLRIRPSGRYMGPRPPQPLPAP